MQGLALLKEDELIKTVAGELKAIGVEGWLVGGAVRDCFLGRPGPPDVDIIVPSNALQVARRLASVLGGSFVALDEVRGIARVVVGEGTQRREIDFAELRADSVEEDLLMRDFTVNALAVGLTDLTFAEVPAAGVLDPSGGRKDLEARLIRVPSPEVLDDDPLRLLRGVRLAAELDFSIEPTTQGAISERAIELGRVAGERIRDELFALLAIEPSWPWIEELVRMGLMDIIAPEYLPMVGLEQGRHHDTTLWAHSVATLRHLEGIFSRLDRELPEDTADLEEYLSESLEAKITRGALTKWAALWHDVGKPETRAVDDDGEVRFLGHEKAGSELIKAMAGRLKLGRRARNLLSIVVTHHLRPLHLSKAETVTRRACYRFVRDLKDSASAVCLVALADARATREGGERATDVEGIVRKILAYRREQQDKPSLPLVAGKELMVRYGLPEGPLVGRLLAIVEEARAEGEVASKEEAFDYLDVRKEEWRGQG